MIILGDIIVMVIIKAYAKNQGVFINPEDCIYSWDGHWSLFNFFHWLFIKKGGEYGGGKPFYGDTLKLNKKDLKKLNKVVHTQCFPDIDDEYQVARPVNFFVKWIKFFFEKEIHKFVLLKQFSRTIKYIDNDTEFIRKAQKVMESGKNIYIKAWYGKSEKYIKGVI